MSSSAVRGAELLLHDEVSKHAIALAQANGQARIQTLPADSLHERA